MLYRLSEIISQISVQYLVHSKCTSQNSSILTCHLTAHICIISLWTYILIKANYFSTSKKETPLQVDNKNELRLNLLCEQLAYLSCLGLQGNCLWHLIEPGDGLNSFMQTILSFSCMWDLRETDLSDIQFSILFGISVQQGIVGVVCRWLIFISSTEIFLV